MPHQPRRRRAVDPTVLTNQQGNLRNVAGQQKRQSRLDARAARSVPATPTSGVEDGLSNLAVPSGADPRSGTPTTIFDNFGAGPPKLPPEDIRGPRDPADLVTIDDNFDPQTTKQPPQDIRSLLESFQSIVSPQQQEPVQQDRTFGPNDGGGGLVEQIANLNPNQNQNLTTGQQAVTGANTLLDQLPGGGTLNVGSALERLGLDPNLQRNTNRDQALNDLLAGLGDEGAGRAIDRAGKRIEGGKDPLQALQKALSRSAFKASGQELTNLTPDSPDPTTPTTPPSTPEPEDPFPGTPGPQDPLFPNVPPAGDTDFNPPEPEDPVGNETVELGQDPLSTSIENTLGNILGSGGGSQTEFGLGIRDALGSLIQGEGNFDTSAAQQRIGGLEDILDRRGQASDRALNFRLASQGIDPGSGVSSGALERAQEGRDAEFGNIVSQFLGDEADRSSDRFISGLGLGAQQSGRESDNLLSALGLGTTRQTAIDRASLDRLALNQDFNKTLAEFGLIREQAGLEERRQQIELLFPLLQLLGQAASQSAGGFV